jgi:hypothetical protein
MRTWVATLLLLAATSTACASDGSESPAPDGTPSLEEPGEPPVGYVLTSADWRRLHRVECRQPQQHSYGY